MSALPSLELAPGPELAVWPEGRASQQEVHELGADGEYILGRAESCDIVIADPLVSERHLRVIVTRGAPKFIDRKSTNGTFLNGRRAASGELGDGDVLQVGGHFIQVHIHRTSSRTPHAFTPSLTPGVSSLLETQAAVLRVAGSVSSDYDLTGVERGHLDKLLGDDLGIGHSRARRRLNGLAADLRIPEDVQRTPRWQMVVDTLRRRPRNGGADRPR